MAGEQSIQQDKQAEATGAAPPLSQSMSCCSLSEMGCPKAIPTMHSVTPIVANAQQHPHGAPPTCCSTCYKYTSVQKPNEMNGNTQPVFLPVSIFQLYSHADSHFQLKASRDQGYAAI